MQRRVSTAATGFLPDTRPGLLCSLGTVRPSPLWPPSLTISSLLSLAPSAPGFWSWVLGLQRGPPKFRGLGVLAEGVCALGVGVARWAARACGFYACPQLLAIRMLVAQASGMHQSAGVEEGGGPSLPPGPLSVCLLCPLPPLVPTAFPAAPKDWKGVKGLGGSFKPPLRKDLPAKIP